MNKFLIIAFTLLCTGWAVNAQNITIKGQVLDNLKEPVPMANISQVGTTNGTISDIDGNYTISVPVGATLEFSFIGFKSERRTVGKGMTVLNVTLQEDSQVLDAVVVTALGIKRQFFEEAG